MLGPLGIEGVDGRWHVAAPREAALLAELLTHGGGPVAARHLARSVWADADVRDPVHAVHTVISRLRARLAAAAGQPGRSLLVYDSQCYALALEGVAVDAWQFAAQTAHARHLVERGHVRKAVRTYDEALSLWRGEPLDGVGDDSPCIRAERSHLDEQRLDAVQELARARLTLGEHDVVATDLAPLVAAHPLREGLRACLMRALYRSGRVAEALECYRVGHEFSAQQLGLDPGADLRQLRDQILAEDASLDRPSNAVDRSPDAAAVLPQLTATAAPTAGPVESAALAQPGGVDLDQHELCRRAHEVWHHVESLHRRVRLLEQALGTTQRILLP